MRSLIASIPASLIEQAKEPFSARCLLFALLLDNKNQEARKRQAQMIEQQAEEGTLTKRRKSNPSIKSFLRTKIGLSGGIKARYFRTFDESIFSFPNINSSINWSR